MPSQFSSHGSTSRLAHTALLILATIFSPQLARAGQTNDTEFRTQFLKLCDTAASVVNQEQPKGRYFVDSYAVRALCAAYDLTANTNYLDACRNWSDRMVKAQEQMIPRGAYYMHYNRKPGETNGDWYVADSASIGMAVLATSVRCQGAERERFLKSATNFAGLVIKNYVKPSGGITDGLWSKSDDEWWCSSAIFGSFLFNLYANTGNKEYLDTGLRVTHWLNHWDLARDQPFPLSQQGPAMIFYVMENYSAGRAYMEKDQTINQAATARINWCFDWIAAQQNKTPADRQWPPASGWGLKFGGLPFHQYTFAGHLAGNRELKSDGDAEMQRLATLQIQKPDFTQLSAFMMMSYAERLAPGAIYRSRR